MYCGDETVFFYTHVFSYIPVELPFLHRYGFNCGSALLLDSPNSGQIVALAGVNSTLSAGFGGLTALFANLWYLERYTGEPFFDLKYAMNGALAGLVAITAGCGVVEPWVSALFFDCVDHFCGRCL